MGEEVDRLETEIGEKDRLIAEKAQAAQILEEDIDEIRQKLGVKLQRISQTGGFTDLQLLFNAEDYADYLLKSQCVKRITEKDQTDMAALERDILTLEEEREELALVRSAVAAQKETAEGLRREADGKIREMESVYVEVRAVVQKLEKDQQKLEQSLKENQKMQQEMDRKIAELNKKPSEVGGYQGRHYVLAGSHRPYPQRFLRGAAQRQTSQGHRYRQSSHHPDLWAEDRRGGGRQGADGVYRQHRRRRLRLSCDHRSRL